jgi:hypothetical protein
MPELILGERNNVHVLAADGVAVLLLSLHITLDLVKSELSGFQTLSIAWYSKIRKHNVSVLRRGEETPTLLGPLERANLNHFLRYPTV